MLVRRTFATGFTDENLKNMLEDATIVFIDRNSLHIELEAIYAKSLPTSDLGELLKLLNLSSTSHKPFKAPTRKKLRNTVGEPIAVGDGCEVYKSGWAVYDNGFGRTVIWLPKCTDFTYQFGELKQCEKEYLKQKDKLDGGLLEKQSWFLAVTLIGEYRVEANMMNRTSSRVGTRVNGSVDKDGNDNGDIEEVAYSKYIDTEDNLSRHFTDSGQSKKMYHCW